LTEDERLGCDRHEYADAVARRAVEAGESYADACERAAAEFDRLQLLIAASVEEGDLERLGELQEEVQRVVRGNP
jgi:hypothetical protein